MEIRGWHLSRWQYKTCSFSLCSPMNYTFSFQRVSRAKSWNVTLKIADFHARTPQFDQFAVVTARPRLGTSSITTSRVEGTKFLILQTLPHTSAHQENFSVQREILWVNATGGEACLILRRISKRSPGGQTWMCSSLDSRESNYRP